ncbi:DUF1624 domain-containing protein [Candidatus Venteria ishoeyi]|uniref:Heparan-alpha-glucosaminide N-acetyltransferase catalytic domain-containing protein n=1 Tax=Candidatus Venteria ishoeyi TaxID=1899563 RepID=A0A1H6F3N4_9GAMM|nr:heparan-alpha-glucosaminide N-acetyltransferase domain-containing protein [Candidatus Venteria ishoeyi]SEH04203.1 Uncharacterised protein [Candidatus Venteria ishoeyi]
MPSVLIFFGILHLIATASIIAAILNYFLKKHYGLFLPLGLALIALGIWLQHPFFNQSSLQWLGLMTYKPPTEDYVPLLPWLGVVVLGLFAGHICEKHNWLQQQTLPHFTRPLVFAGKHGLLIYMLHQPILIGLLWVLLFAAKNI